MDHPMRRREKRLSEERSYEILQEADYGILSTVSKEGIPYGVPLNFVLSNEDIYFHSASEGHKIDNLEANPEVSFSVVGEAKILPESFDTSYESVIVFGIAEEVYEAKKRRALEALLEKFSPDFYERGLKFIEDYLDIVRVFKISIERITGKANS